MAINLSTAYLKMLHSHKIDVLEEIDVNQSIKSK